MIRHLVILTILALFCCQSILAQAIAYDAQLIQVYEVEESEASQLDGDDVRLKTESTFVDLVIEFSQSEWNLYVEPHYSQHSSQNLCRAPPIA